MFFFYSPEIELGTYINSSSFGSSWNDLFRIIYSLWSTKISATPNGSNPRFAKISPQTLTSKRYNTLGLVAITHRKNAIPFFTIQLYHVKNSAKWEKTRINNNFFYLASLLGSMKIATVAHTNRKTRTKQADVSVKTSHNYCLKAKPEWEHLFRTFLTSKFGENRK